MELPIKYPGGHVATIGHDKADTTEEPREEPGDD